MNGIEYNYCALAISILARCSPEEAFKRLEKGKRKHRTGEESRRIDEQILHLKSMGFTNIKIAEILGISDSAVSDRLHKMKKRGEMQ